MIWNVLALKSRPNHKYWSIHKMRVIKKFSSLVPFGFENILVQRDHIFSSWFYQWKTVSKIFYIPLMTELVVISVLKFSSSNELISTVTAPVNSGIWIWSCCEIEMIGPFSVKIFVWFQKKGLNWSKLQESKFCCKVLKLP